MPWPRPTPGASGCTTTASPAWSTPTSRTWCSASRRRTTGSPGRPSSTPRPRPSPRSLRPSRPGRRSRCSPGRPSCCAGPRRRVAELRATYRVQLRPEFGFDAAAGLAGYLAALGVSHLYCSPFLQAAPGSTHGYDVVDYGWLNEELGGAGGHQRMTEALDALGIGQVLDVVPNHMA